MVLSKSDPVPSSQALELLILSIHRPALRGSDLLLRRPDPPFVTFSLPFTPQPQVLQKTRPVYHPSVLLPCRDNL